MPLILLTLRSLLAATLFALTGPAAAQLAVPDLGGSEAEAGADDPAGVAEALRLLALVLDDPEARAILVEQLRAAETSAAAEPGAGVVPLQPDAAATLPEIIAGQTVEAVENVSEGTLDLLRTLVDIRDFIRNAPDLDLAYLGDRLVSAGLTIAATFAAFWATRALARSLLARVELRAAAAAPLLLLLWRALAIVVEALAVTTACAIGLAASLVGFASGEITPSQTLFLNAFLVTELAHVGIRIVFKPEFPTLRLIRMAEPTARYWRFWLGRIAGVLGYGLLFVVPLLEPEVSQRFAEWLRLLIVVLAFAMAIAVILRNRRRVREAMEARVARLPADAIASGLAALARVWHLIAIGYIVALFIVWRAHPGDAESFMLRATGWSALAILLGAFVIALLTRRIAGGVRLSDNVKRKLPLLETRLNRFVPTALKVFRFVVAALVLATILTVWGVADLPRWARTETGERVLASVGWILGILLVAGLLWLLVSSWVEYRLNPDLGREPTARERTLLALFSNAFVIALVVATLMAVLSEVGINIAPLLAGAGVVGLAIGFGAQKLVQDIINGAFIQFENTMNEGDIVTAGTTTGVVEKLTIRSVSLRDLNGNLHMIPFSGVDNVTNFTKTFSFHVADIGVAYREKVADVKEAMNAAFDQLMETEHRATILPPLEMLGVEALAESAVIVRARIKTLPGKQWGVGRAYNEIVKEVFDARGIEIPFPHRTLYFGEDRQGGAPPLNIRRAPTLLPGSEQTG